MNAQVTSQLLMVRPANFSSNKETIETNKFQNDLTADLKERSELTSEAINGPVLIQDTNSTIFVPQEWKVSKDSEDNVILVKEN